MPQLNMTPWTEVLVVTWFILLFSLPKQVTDAKITTDNCSKKGPSPLVRKQLELPW